MAITKILTINDCGRKFHGKHFQKAIFYIIDETKTQNGKYVSGINCQPEQAFEQMLATKRKYGKMDKRQGYHLIISFEEEHLSPDIAFQIVREFTEEFLGEGYEAIYAVHDNTAHTHGHIIYNSVNYLTGKKFRYERGDWAKIMQPITNRLCEKYGLATLEIELEGDYKQKHYRDFNEFRDGKFIWKDMIQRDVDACILQSDTFEEFLDMLMEKGYEIKQGKHLAVKPMGMQRFCRLKTLGERYVEECIRERIRNDDIRSYARRNKEPSLIVSPDDEFLRRTKLVGIQKTYYAKVCTIRHLKQLPYSKAWQYREDIRKLEEVQEQYLFLVRNDIHSLEDLVRVTEELSLQAKENRRLQREVKKENARYEPLYVMKDRMDDILCAEHSYQDGDTFFQKEHEEYVRLEQELAEKGYTVSEVENLRRYYKDKLSGLYHQHREDYAKLKLAKGMIAEVQDALERVQELEQEKENIMKQEQPKR